MSSPAITVMIQFTRANPRFLKYTNRKEAVKRELERQQFQSEGVNDEIANQIRSEIPELTMNFERYVNYTNRAYATKKASYDEQTTMFTPNENNATMETFNELKHKLNQAQNNQSVMWQLVTSFDTNFLKEQGLIDSKTQEVNQRALKETIRAAMPELLKREGLSESVFWWGNIHLNTNHVHAHIGISEINSARKIYAKNSSEVEFKGKFKQKSIKAFKSKIYHGLIRQREKKILLNQAAYVDFLKKEVVKQVTSPIEQAQAQQEFLLNQVYQHLPADRRGWRYKSNAQTFKLSKFYLDKYLDNYLAKSQDYQDFLAESKTYLAKYHQVYSKNDSNLEKAFEKRVLELRAQLGNRILKELKRYDDKLKTQKKGSKPTRRNNLPEVAQLQQLAPNDLEQLIEILKTQGTASDVLGRYKYALRQANLISRQTALNTLKLRLKQVKPLATDLPFIEFKRAEIEDLSLLVGLQIKPNYKLTKTEREAKTKLAQKYLEVTKISLKQVTSQVVKTQMQRLQTELQMAQAVKDDSLFKLFGAENKATYLKQLQQQLTILETKFKIKQNNDALKNAKPETQKRLKRANVELLASLNNQLAAYKAGITEEKQVTKTPSQSSKATKVIINLGLIPEESLEKLGNKSSITKKAEGRKVVKNKEFKPYRPRLGVQFTQSLAKMISYEEKEKLKALRQKSYDDEQIEYEDRLNYRRGL